MNTIKRFPAYFQKGDEYVAVLSTEDYIRVELNDRGGSSITNYKGNGESIHSKYLGMDPYKKVSETMFLSVLKMAESRSYGCLFDALKLQGELDEKEDENDG